MGISDAEVGSEYDEFPELEEKEFQELARARVKKLMKTFMPSDHPPATEFILEVWVDGLATGLRMSKEDG